MKLFPFILGRSGGASITSLESLKSERVSFQTQQLREIHHQLTQVKSQINDLLYERISNTSEPATQNRLLTLKRDIYNDRIDSTCLPNGLLVDTILACLLKRYFAIINQQKEDNQAAEAIYQSELSRSVDQLNDIVAERYFQNGLLMASSDLYQRTTTKSDLDFTNKKDRRLVFTLLKYLTRSVTKTTPFSTFNSIFCLESQGNDFVPVPVSRSSYLSINNIVFHYLQETIIALPETRDLLTVTLNPTIRQDENHLCYFINQANNDAFRRLKKQPLNAYIIQLLQQKKLNYEETIAHLVSVVNEPSQKVRFHLDQLINEGFLILEFPVSVHNTNWPTQIVHFLTKCPLLSSNKLGSEIISFLQTVTCTKLLLEHKPNVRTRQRFLNRVYKQLQQLQILIAQNYPSREIAANVLPASASDVFYEDSTTSSVYPLRSTDVAVFKEDLLLLNRTLQCSNISYYLLEECRQRLSLNFGTESVSLLRFLEQVYYPQKEEVLAGAVQRLSLKESRALDIATLVTDIRTSWPEDVVDLKAYLKPFETQTEKHPFGVFCQMVPGPNSLCIINNITAGCGKNISRFLNFYPEAAQALRSTLDQHFANSCVVEIKDASLHNTNQYPILGNSFIAIPGVVREKSGLKSIPLQDLFICTDTHEKLSIQDRTGQVVLPVDFAIEGIQRKSALAQFLNHFNPANSSEPSSLIAIVEKLYVERLVEAKGGMVAIPRINFGPHLVLQRKKWIVKKKTLLKRLSSNCKWKNFTALQQWRQYHQIPEEVYVKIKHASDYTTDHYKPQYINFSIPLLAEYFVLLINKADSLISFTEMLPQVGDIPPEAEAHKLVREYILNFT